MRRCPTQNPRDWKEPKSRRLMGADCRQLWYSEHKYFPVFHRLQSAEGHSDYRITVKWAPNVYAFAQAQSPDLIIIIPWNLLSRIFQKLQVRVSTWLGSWTRPVWSGSRERAAFGINRKDRAKYRVRHLFCSCLSIFLWISIRLSIYNLQTTIQNPE